MSISGVTVKMVAIGVMLVSVALMITDPQSSVRVVAAESTPVPTKGGQSSAVAIVTKLEDTDDGRCEAEDCSLREAVNGLTNGGEITFADGINGTINLHGEISINKIIKITGHATSANDIVLNATFTHKIFQVASEGDLTLRLLSLTAVNDFFTSGGIFIDRGTLTVMDCAFHDNRDTVIESIGGKVTVIRSSFYNNLAVVGGAIANVAGILRVENSTFYGNTASLGGAIANINGSADIAFSTFVSNKADSANTITSSGKISINNSILDGYREDATSVRGNTNCVLTVPLIDAGNNLQFPNDDCGNTIKVIDPLLAMLGNNGGPTQTVALLEGSLALNTGSCTEQLDGIDQRGMPRTDGKCDIGAYEKQ